MESFTEELDFDDKAVSHRIEKVSAFSTAKVGDLEAVFRMCEHLMANRGSGIDKIHGTDHYFEKRTKA